MADEELGLPVDEDDDASSGHKLGQLIGDWFEGFFVQPLLQAVADRLKLYLDSRFNIRASRGDKVQWTDAEGNSVDYDFVLEIGGTDDRRGIPVAFVECFWRRGKRHSKDKARDDTGKLAPMRDVYPTARFLGIVAAGDFTKPARELVRSRSIDLFCVPKDKVVKAFQENGIFIDYSDKTPEDEKRQITATFEAAFTNDVKPKVAKSLMASIGKAAVKAYSNRIHAALAALPQEIRIICRYDSAPVAFDDIHKVTDFLRDGLAISIESAVVSYVYQVTYSDGSEFERPVGSLDELKKLQNELTILAAHVEIF